MRTTDVSTIAPVFPDDSPRGERLARRFRTIPLEILAFVVATLLLPLLAMVALVADLALWLVRRKPWVGIRLTLFLWWFLLGEMRALATIAWIWFSNGGPFRGDSERRRLGIYNLRVWWCRHHLSGIRALFGLRFEVENLEVAGPGPVIVMIRHASIIDNTLPDALISHAHGIGLRYVIKRELQSIPVIDIGGRWCPTNFVRRASGDAEGEIKRLVLLAEDLEAGEGILIYPEGTRATAPKIARAKEKVAAARPDLAPVVGRLENLLPPRLGGTLAILEELPDVDVVFCGHVGFDGFERIGDIWSGALVGKTIEVTNWRVPAAEIPEGREEQTRWLYENWQRMDDWVGERLPGPPAD